MTEWYYSDGQDRQGPLLVEDLRQRFQRGEISLTTLVWREGYPQWKPVSEAVEELQLQNLTSAASNLGSGFDLRGDYTAIDNGTAPLPGTGGGTYRSIPHRPPPAATARPWWAVARWSTTGSGSVTRRTSWTRSWWASSTSRSAWCST